MSDIAISVHNLGKMYHIGAVQNGRKKARYRTFQETLIDGLAAPFRRTRSLLRGEATGAAGLHQEMWALKDVSFEVKHGEVVGIIGRNGAGKSTLLKILSRITEPTEGYADVVGRVGSLLEVGTGFHPELTGRENVYLNGAVLGMRRAEIDRKFDEIVDFSGVEQFIDTPVKHYSSGMYVRLAFAVAAHLEPEILVVDEVLAVGDVGFQKKCLGKMSDVAGQGRTVLFVSHNMQAIRSLCSRSILLNEGEISADAATEETLHRYNQIMRNMKVDESTSVHNPLNRRGSGAVRFSQIEILDADGETQHTFEMGATVQFRLSYNVFEPVTELMVSVALRSGLTSEIVTSVRHPISCSALEPGESGAVIVVLPEVYLRPGEYPLYFWLGKLDIPYDVVDDLTAPLTIQASTQLSDQDFLVTKPIGYFSVPSSLKRVAASNGRQE